MRTTILAPTIAAATALAALLTGCSSVTEGNPTPVAAESSSAATTSDEAAAPGTMDPGNFRTTAQPDFGTVANEATGRIVEGQRMAEFVVLPTEVDPKMTRSAGLSTYVIKNGAAVSNVLAGNTPQIAEREGMITGFSSARQYEDLADSHSLVQAVFRFPDPAAASRAAAEFSADDLIPSEYLPAATVTPIDGLPDSLVTSRESNGNVTTQSFTPHGDYVLYTWVNVPVAERADIAKDVTTALDQQAPLIDKFPATPVDKLASLPMDIDGVLKLTVPPQGTKQTSSLAVYGPRGAAHFSTNPTLTVEFMDESDTTLLARNDTNVYRSESADGAEKLYELFQGDVVDNSGMTESDAPPGVPGSSCFSKETPQGTGTYCIVHVGRYLGEISGLDNETAVHQETTAQYMILEAASH